MASSESQTELLTGWSCVVHQPSEDPEPSELPSTVDITAFSGGLNVEPSAANNDLSESDSESDTDSNNSGSDGTGSCSQSDSSDSDSSSSSQGTTSRSSSPEFSVTSQPNGLRLTIATVRKPCPSPPPVADKPPSKPESNKPPDKGAGGSASLSKILPERQLNLSSDDSDDDDASSCSDSESDSGGGSGGGAGAAATNAAGGKEKENNVKKVVTAAVVKTGTTRHTRNCDRNKVTDGGGGSKKVVKKEVCSPKAPVAAAAKAKTGVKRKRMAASLPLSRSSTCSSTDSDESETDSAILHSCLQLQEIRQEDLAAILPDQQELDAFDAFEETEKNSPQTGDASGSDMELPQQAVNALIMRTTESSSESESHPPPNPNTLYANSLIQQFVAQTQILNSSNGTSTTAADSGASSNTGNGKNGEMQTSSAGSDDVKRKRGRPKKISKPNNSSEKLEYCGDPNVSPDSGIQNSPDHVSSPDCSPLPSNKGKYNSSEMKKPQVPDNKTSKSAKPISRTKEPSKLTVTSNRFDRILYGNTDRVLYPPRRKVGRPPVTRKGPGRPPKAKPPIENKVPKPTAKTQSKSMKNNKDKSTAKDIMQITSNTNSLNLNTEVKVNGSNKSTHLSEICERVSKRLEMNNKNANETANKKNRTSAAKVADKKTQNEKKERPKLKTNRVVLGNKNKVDMVKVKTIKNSKLMHSKHKHKKHKKCKFKILKTSVASADPKFNAEIEKLVQDFVKFCNISTVKQAKENVPEIVKALKKVTKKRKTSDGNDRKKKKQNVANVVTNETNSNEQRLPLKKRHYHLTANNENKPDDLSAESDNAKYKRNSVEIENDAKNNKCRTILRSQDVVDKGKTAETDAGDIRNRNNKALMKTQMESEMSSNSKTATINNNEYDVNQDAHINEAIEACITKYADVKKEKSEEKVILTTTPKKRHRLELVNKVAETNVVEKQEVSLESVVSEIKMKRNLTSKFVESKKVECSSTRKKTRLEDLTSSLANKVVPVEDVVKKKEVRATVIKYPACKKAKPIESDKLDLVVDEKPTGIFMPTVDLEIHIPKDAIKEEVKEPTKPPELSVDSEAKPGANIQFKKRIRKRRAINRTGFPTVKKKKKKVIASPETKLEAEVQPPCDRVPKDGEEYSTFVERTTETGKVVQNDIVAKWEVLSECDSLPLEDRIDFDSLSRQGSVVSERNFEPAGDGVTVSDVDELTLEERIRKSRRHERLKRKRGLLDRKCNDGSSIKRRLRDVSPASSTDRYIDKCSKEDSASGDESKRSKKPPRWRKKYLVAGLFSDYYKEDDESQKQKRNETLASKSKQVYNPSEHPYGLMPAPFHCGKHMRSKDIPFQLPYELWWLHTHSQLPGRDIVPSWNYRKIRTNVYNVKNTSGACEPQSCNCTSLSPCGDDCINRLVLSECPASHKCKNQKIQKHEWAPGIEKFMTENKGWGVKTHQSIKHGEFILEYVGEVVSDQEFKERMATRYIYDTHHYCLHLDGGLVIDGHRMGGDGRFVNHSCEPNCEMQKWTVNGQFRMALFALRDIEAGEEITYDYNFSLFNPAEGQECKCGSDICRGVIGGKSQRVRQIPTQVAAVQQGGTGRVGRPRKNQAKKSTSENGEEKPTIVPPPMPVVTVTAQTASASQMKPLSNAQKVFVMQHHVFLLKNLRKVKKSKTCQTTATVAMPPCEQNDSTTFINHLNALRQPRSIRTRRLALADDNPELKKTVQLANILRGIYNKILDFRDEEKVKLSPPFLLCPPKRKVPEYYQKIAEPIDLTTIEQNIANGVYKTVESFDHDIHTLFNNVINFYGRTSELGIASAKLKKTYNDAKKECAPLLQAVLGVKPPTKFMNNKRKGSEEEDVIRCICGMYRDEGLMIQCERCLVWQHCECVRADVNAPSYHCEKCVPKKVDYEIAMDEYTEHGHQYYMTLMRGDLQLRQGDTVYMLRDIPIPGTDKKHTYDTIGEVRYADLDIFRIERLWKDSKNGQRFAYGHHYLRPHETYHEPTRRFFPNEVMRVPLYEAVPVELVISRCWVLDINTYCKGRPIGAPPEHIYICEYRVDKSARLFSKVSKSKFPMCTKTYAFERFDVRLKISRTYTPHDLDPVYLKHRGRKPQDADDIREVIAMPPTATVKLPVQIPVIKTRKEKIERLNGILLRLLAKLPTKQPLDVSYLLEGGRRRKKQQQQQKT